MCLYPIKVRPHKKGEPRGSGEVIEVSCGKCLECERQKSFEWAFRIMDECSLHEQNCMITLTYNDDCLPSPPSVSRREVQLFMKSLRDRIKPLRIRFFACGEYGKLHGRPHYHIIIFGWFPSDARQFFIDHGVQLYRSKLLESVWDKGFSSVGKVTLDAAKYCAKYLNKFKFRNLPGASISRVVVDGEETPFYDALYPPFVQMSNRPGIGFGCVYRCNLDSDRVYRNGSYIKIPRYYLKVMERDGIYLDEFRERRKRNGEMIASLTDLDFKREKFYEKFLRKKYVKTVDK